MRRLLIANRGEIACRIVRTARRMGIDTIAVFEAGDAGAAHTVVADAALPIASYLNVAAIVDAARRGAADAVHPGYGFLSENADFAAACAAAGLIFVGPPVAAIRAMGSKSAAKQRAAASGVPVLPGYHGDDQSRGALVDAARAVGFPLLIKAAYGGGGRGMRVVRSRAELDEALTAAAHEAAAAFGDGTLLFERFLERPRHIEVQIFADNAGQTVGLFDRDCSIQRRHQKIVEEAPAPGLAPALRQAMTAAAIAVARAVGYAGAGTVEFLVEDDAFYFMEMNTRLQVEHPVTEAITGLDLVEWQIRIARGEALPVAPDQIRQSGHAVEARLCAEDPARDFLPQTGVLTRWHLPDGEGVRCDSGVRAGDRIGIAYDPLLAKLIAWAPDRGTALRRLEDALAQARIAGVTTNHGLLLAIVGDPEMRAGPVDTGYLPRRIGDLLDRAVAAETVTYATAALLALETGSDNTVRSPWRALPDWRALALETLGVDLLLDGTVHAVRYTRSGAAIAIVDGNRTVRLTVRASPGGVVLCGDDRVVPITAWPDGSGWTIVIDRRQHRVARAEIAAADAVGDGLDAALRAPMPGRVGSVRVSAGDSVARGQVLVTLEAMKMEHGLHAPRDGVVERVACGVGQLVEEGVELVVLEALP